MAAPILTLTNPADGDTNIPVGYQIKLYFDRGVDIQTVKNNIVLFGADYDRTSGPDQVIWVDKDTGENPYFLRSPGFKGTVPLSFTFEYYTLGTTTVVDPGSIISEANEISEDVGHVVTIVPETGPLAADIEYKLYISGDPDNTNVGVSSRTVFDTVPGGSNANEDATIQVYGTYTRNAADTLNVKITTAGNPNTAVYKWWYTSFGEGSSRNGILSSRRYRALLDGLQIRFPSTGYVVNDTYTVNLEPITRMAESTSISFTTNDGSYSTAPDSPSTPAESSPPASTLPSTSGSTFSVVGINPEYGAYNVNVSKNREITVTFSEDLDADTITQSTVTLWVYPVDGNYGDTFEPYQLQKKLEVDDNILTITF